MAVYAELNDNDYSIIQIIMAEEDIEFLRQYGRYEVYPEDSYGLPDPREYHWSQADSVFKLTSS